MGRQFLDSPSTGTVADIVRRLGAVLSTDGSLAELAIRTRLTTSSAGGLAVALADGDVIEVFAFRGAKHYLSADEGWIYLALRSAGRQWEQASWVEHYGLTPADWPAFRGAVRGVLSD
ncbi:MAG: crosslink repair DNA glycosylase YcaQ family protein [Ilumatobacteraceae bacterium]